MSMYKVEICGVNTSKLPLLNEEEKEKLIHRIKAGDYAAREKYIKCNLRLVLSIVQRFSNSNENLDDLFQIGVIGLIKAIDNFDTSLNVKFSTYAVPMIRGELRRYLRDNNAIRVSRSLRDIAYKALYTKEALIKKNDREPTLEEISECLELPAELVRTAMDAIQTPLSLYEPVFQDGGDSLYLMDQICDKKSREDEWIKKLSLRQAMNQLTQREQGIIRLRFFHGKTQMEVAKEIHISQAQVSRLEKTALSNMRKFLE